MNRPASQNRWPHVSATVVLIAALTLAACAPAGTTTTLTTAPPATPTLSATPTTASPAEEDAATEIARLFLEAYAAHDADRAASYLAADALANFGGSLETLRLEMKHSEAQGFKLLLDPCEELTTSSSGTIVRCPYDYHGIRSDEIGLGPYGDNYYDLTILDGEIVSMSNYIAFMTNGFSDQIWEPFAEWVAETYPEDGAIMYENWPSIGMAQFSEEASELWEQRSREYVEEQNPGVSGLTGLPPEDATPSTPESGELIASMWEHIGAPGSFGNGWLYVYADGRLIWERADPDPTGGWLEQRLTTEGVELIRSEIIATELFHPDQPAPASIGEAQGGSVQVRNGEELVYINRVLPELMERLAELWSWLPDDAWEDIEAKPYVPSRYVVCVQDGGSPTYVSDDLSTLPAAARDLLAGAEQIHLEALVSVDPAGFAGLEGSKGYCYNVATEEARILATTLDGAGVEELPQPWYGGSEVVFPLTKSVDEYLSNPFDTITLHIWPMLPHGVPAFTGA